MKNNSWCHVKSIEDLSILQDNSQQTDDMISLVRILTNKNPELKFTDDHVTTILKKLEYDQRATYIANLLIALKENNPGLKFTDDHVTTILKKLPYEPANSIAGLIKNNPWLKFTNDHVTTILKKLPYDRTDSIAGLIRALKENNPELKFTDEHITTILEKVEDGLPANSITNLISTLHNSGVELNEEHLKMIWNKLNDESIVAIAKLALELKKINPNLNFNNVDKYQWICSLNNIKVSTKDEKSEDNNINMEATGDENIENKPDGQMLYGAIMQYFEYKLQSLKKNLNKYAIDNEKAVLIQIAKDLQKEKMLDSDQVERFKDKIQDIYDLNGFVTFIQWLGCVLSVTCTLFVSLTFDCIRNRVCFRTESTRKFERLRDNKDKLIAPLQKICNSRVKSNNSIL